MKVLQMNKFLYGGGGPETVMFRTTALLREHGHEVAYFAMQHPRNEPCAEAKYFPPRRSYTAEASRVMQARSAASSIYSFAARRSLRRLLAENRPDVAHLHNVYHQLTLSVVDELAAHGVPMVMTVHDYKPVCPSYQAYIDHQPCRRCVTGHPGHVIAHRCIKGSTSASVIASLEAVLTRTRRLYMRIGTFIVPSHHCGQMLIAGGFPAERIRLIPNFVESGQFADRESIRPADRPNLLFVGRLEEAKGIDVLLEAADRLAGTVEISVVGDGPWRAQVEAADRAGRLRYLGRQDWPQIASLMDQASAIVLPSVVEENCPMVVLEAGARGRPVVTSDRGGLPELVDDGQDGLLVPAGDAAELANAMSRVGGDASRAHQMGLARLERTMTNHSASAYFDALMAVYRENQGASTSTSASAATSEADHGSVGH
jgi:glycosyltransferase involved in cell wall biosynthesis